MPTVRRVAREAEPVEFRPVPGQEERWAGWTYVQRSDLWYWLGVYPVGAWIVLVLLMIGATCG